MHFITMELVEGRNLTELLPKDGFPLPRLLEVAIPLADAVSSAHRAGITHRDLKPDNVMIDGEGRLRVLDFGLAKLHDTFGSTGDTQAATVTSDTASGRILGTVAYMSPEQAEGKEGRRAVGHLLAGHDPLRDGVRHPAVPRRHHDVDDQLDPQGRAVLDHRAEADAAAPRGAHPPSLPGQGARPPLPDRARSAQRAGELKAEIDSGSHAAESGRHGEPLARAPASDSGRRRSG